ncbi:MAG: hypothetical protein GY898_16350 [Proteobacteria bacterium]|nr:hypothetical protein [Pseudomonadota bacterium]
MPGLRRDTTSTPTHLVAEADQLAAAQRDGFGFDALLEGYDAVDLARDAAGAPAADGDDAGQQVLEALAHHTDDAVRLLVAQNRTTPATGVALLLTDPDPEIRYDASLNRRWRNNAAGFTNAGAATCLTWLISAPWRHVLDEAVVERAVAGARESWRAIGRLDHVVSVDRLADVHLGIDEVVDLAVWLEALAARNRHLGVAAEEMLAANPTAARRVPAAVGRLEIAAARARVKATMSASSC